MMNRMRVYNDEELTILKSNPNVIGIKNNCKIIYSDNFKIWAVNERIKHKDKTARQIFIEAGFDMNVLDEQTPRKRLLSWVNKYKKFGEEYFIKTNKYIYKAKQNISDLKKVFINPNVKALLVELNCDGTYKYTLIKKGVSYEKINN